MSDVRKFYAQASDFPGGVLSVSASDFDALAAKFTEIAPCNPGEDAMTIAKRAVDAHRALAAELAEANAKLKSAWDSLAESTALVAERDALRAALERIVEADCCSCFSAMKASEALNSTRDPPTSPPTPGTSTPPQP